MKKYNKISFKKLAIIMISLVIVLAFTACSSKDSEELMEVEVESISAEDSTDEKTTESTREDVTEIGVGDTMFVFTVTFEDATVHVYEVSTDETTVGAALLAEGLIEGEDSELGLYVKTVDGVTLDYDTDTTYWAFYIDGDMASSGVDTTDIVEGAMYSLAYAK